MPNENTPKRNRTFTDGSVAGIKTPEGEEAKVDARDIPANVTQLLVLDAITSELGAAARQDGIEGARTTIKQMLDGVWTNTRITVFTEAVARVFNADPMAVAAKLATMSDEELEAIRKSKAVSAAQKEIAYERAKKKAAEAADDLPDLTF